MIEMIEQILMAVREAAIFVTQNLPKIGAAVKELISKIPPEVWKPLIEFATEGIKALFGTKDTAAEIGEKARIAAEEGCQPEDFKSTSDYLKHLEEKIQIDRAKFEALTPEEIQARELAGTAIFVQGMEEKCGMPVPTEFLKVVSKIAMSASTVLRLAEMLKTAEVTLDDVIDYLKERCKGDKLEAVDAAFKQAIAADHPDMDADKINETILAAQEWLKD